MFLSDFRDTGDDGYSPGRDRELFRCGFKTGTGTLAVADFAGKHRVCREPVPVLKPPGAGRVPVLVLKCEIKDSEHEDPASGSFRHW